MNQNEKILNKKTPDEIEHIISSALIELKNSGISVLRQENIIIIAVPPQHIDFIRNKIASMPGLEKLVIVKDDDKKECIPDVNHAKESDVITLELLGKPDLPELVDNVVKKTHQHYMETKSKQINQIQKKLYTGYARAQFNQRKHMHNIIRIKHK